MQQPFDLAWLLVALPALGFLINAFWGQRLGRRTVGYLGTGVVFAAFGVACVLFYALMQRAETDRQIVVPLARWIDTGLVSAGFEMLIDPLSILMVLIVTGVGGLIHLYSIGYMHDDPEPARFFTYLNLFIAMMVMLVTANNMLLMFVGWEGVGLCSYLLIGFWYKDKENCLAGNKAFIVNRIGDFGFLIALFATLLLFGTVTFVGDGGLLSQLASPDILEGLSVRSAGITFIGLMLLLAAAGKSAQFPLYLWLPDAMAGPTPVSALIHAATMVTAGVVMVTRLSPLFLASPTAQLVMACMGVFTAIFAATIAIAQTDIKKVLAYSTVSQLGYMFLACGVGAYSAGMFHVTTHAFFKALLFLGAGSVIMAMHHEQDMRCMGGLYRRLKITGITMIIGWLAISGIPPLSGFMSKDAILAAAYGVSPYGHILWAIGLATALLTAFYMTRLVGLTFFSTPRWSHANDGHHGQHHEPAESPSTMTVPLIILAILSIGAGVLGGFPALHWPDRFGAFLSPSVGEPHNQAFPVVAHHLPLSLEWALVAASVVAALLGIAVGATIYFKRMPDIEMRPAWILRLMQAQYGYDALLSRILALIVGNAIATFTWKIADVWLIDGLVNGTARATGWLGDRLRSLHSGLVHGYALATLAGAVILLGWLLVAGSKLLR